MSECLPFSSVSCDKDIPQGEPFKVIRPWAWHEGLTARTHRVLVHYEPRVTSF